MVILRVIQKLQIIKHLNGTSTFKKAKIVCIIYIRIIRDHKKIQEVAVWN
jgi:hypothetical protein